jgi:arylsulfatase A-like enzyme
MPPLSLTRLASGVLLTGCLCAQVPNLVVVLADDLGWTDLSGGQTCRGHGSDYHRTPHLDELAANGVAYDAAYSNGPNCTPTRAALLSGQYAPRTGIYTVDDPNRCDPRFRRLDGAPNRRELDGGVVTLAETLRAAGYATGHFGKWHLGDDANGRGPLSQGFDVNVGGTASGWVFGGSGGHFAHADGSWRLPGLGPNGVPYQFMAERLCDEAIAWMTANADRPFFCHVAHFSVHTPLQAPPKDLAAFQNVPPGLRHRDKTYAAMLKNLDDTIGRLVAFLSDTDDPRRPGRKLIDNTVFVFGSDNGGVGGYADAGIAGANEFTRQHPLRGGKGMLTEGGIRVPWIVRWDGVVAPGRIDSTPILAMDFHPTLAAIANAPLPSGQPIDGVDLTPLLRRSALLPARALVWHFPAYLEASTALGTWRTRPVSVIQRGGIKAVFDHEHRSWSLFDLNADLGEHVDLAVERPGTVRELAAELRHWLVDTGAALPLRKGTTIAVPLPDTPGGIGDAVAWTLCAGTASPRPVAHHVLVATDRGVLVFGGRGERWASDELWLFGDHGWQPVAAASPPAARQRHAGCWNPARSELFVFGGASDDGELLDDTVAFSGSGWRALTGAVSPPARRDHAIAFDRARGRVVLFGGGDDRGVRGDTWEHDGAQWIERTPATAPPARAEHGLAHDPRTGRTLLFGGVDARGTLLDDTWAWDGQGWQLVPTASRPPARRAFAFAHDEARDVAVLFGGLGDEPWELGDTWEFDGQGWQRRTPLDEPPGLAGARLAFDPRSGTTLLFGGANATARAFTFRYGATEPAAAMPFGSGCAGTLGEPHLRADSLPWVGAPFRLSASGVSRTVSTAIGFSRTTSSFGPLPLALGRFGAPGCDLLVAPLTLLPMATNAGGANLTIAVPALRSLVGRRLFAQALSVDAGANPLQLAVSQGLAATVGAR